MTSARRGNHDDHDHHDHASHDDHAGHDHAAHAGHDDHSGHDHAAHAGHDDHSGHGHAAHAGHDDHSGHDHAAHAGHDDHAGHDHSGHDHAGHDHAHDLREASQRSLIISLALIGSYMIAEVVGGILSGSLALLADAAHMLTDAGAIALALLAMWLSSRPATIERTFGFHRTEVLAAMINALSLWLITGWIFFEAWNRFRGDEAHEVEGVLMLGVGVVGLLVNIAAAFILHRQSGHSLNVEGAFWHVIADLLGSVGVVISGVLILFFDWWLVDPIASVIIGVLVLLSSWRLTMRVFRVLLDETPSHLDLYRICAAVEDVPGVTLVHDVHARTVTSGYDVFTAHVLVDPHHPAVGEGFAPLRDRLVRLIHDEFGIAHSTLQIEHSLAGCTETHHVGHLEAIARTGRSGRGAGMVKAMTAWARNGERGEGR